MLTTLNKYYIILIVNNKPQTNERRYNMQDLPKTKEQKEFEEFSQVILKLLAELTSEERKHIINYIIFMHNK